MSKHTLYAYVEGADLHEIVESMQGCLDAFAKEGGWRVAAPSVVNQRGTEKGLRDGDLPLWDLGLNLELPDIGDAPEEWFLDVERIARFMGRLHAQFERDFVIGIGNNATGITEDLFTVESDAPDLAELRQIIGVEPRGDA